MPCVPLSPVGADAPPQIGLRKIRRKITLCIIFLKRAEKTRFESYAAARDGGPPQTTCQGFSSPLENRQQLFTEVSTMSLTA